METNNSQEKSSSQLLTRRDTDNDADDTEEIEVVESNKGRGMAME